MINLKEMKTKPIVWEETEQDKLYLQEIRDFLNSEEIPFEEDSGQTGVFHLNDKALQLRYVNSFIHPMDNEKRFGPIGKGIKHSYFMDISHENADDCIRTIWIFDHEMGMTKDNTYEGVEYKNYRRQWEVIKNIIRTATGRIKYHFYARDCEVREVDSKDVRPFLEHNCFYGYRSANVNLGLYLKKDKFGFKKGTLLFFLSFGYNFYGNKKKGDHPNIEIIRASTKIYCQVVGGMSKAITYFCENYPTLKIGADKREIVVDNLIFYCDASHNDGRGMSHSALNFEFVSWDCSGIMNLFTEDYDGSKDDRILKVEKKDKDGNITIDERNFHALKGKKGEIQHRKPMFHKQIMQLMSEGKIISISNAGTSVYTISRQEWLRRNCQKWYEQNWENGINDLKNRGLIVT